MDSERLAAKKLVKFPLSSLEVELTMTLSAYNEQCFIGNLLPACFTIRFFKKGHNKIKNNTIRNQYESEKAIYTPTTIEKKLSSCPSFDCMHLPTIRANIDMTRWTSYDIKNLN